MPLRARTFVLWLAVWGLGCLSAGAAVLIHLSLDEMTEKSSAILVGHCVEVRSAWSADGTEIVTHNAFEVREYFKGNLGSRVTITEPGGRVGNLVADYPGVPRFRLGEEAVLFVWTDPQGQHQVIGLTQGKFRVRRDGKTGEMLLSQTPSDEPMLEPPGHLHRGPAEQMSFSLTAFRDRLGPVLQRSGGARR